jgi:hypothetical protein
MAALQDLRGTTLEDKLGSIGITQGNLVDIRELDTLSGKYGITVYLFFEKDLVHTRTIGQLLEEYRNVPEYERPCIRIDAFLRFTKENDPSFEHTMREFPLMVEIAAMGEMQPAGEGRPVPYVSGLMPFLDELDVDGDPER